MLSRVKHYVKRGYNTVLFAAVLITLSFISLSLSGLLFVTNTYAESISLSIDNANLNIDLMPSKVNGSFAESSTTNITVSTTNYAGYTLNIFSPSDSADLSGTNDSSNKLTSISSNLTASEFSNDSNK